MKRTAKICIAISFISLMAFSAIAQQPSYVLTMDGDSIAGTVKSVKKKSIKFIPENEQKAVKLSAQDIFSVNDAVTGLYYKSFENPLKPQEIVLLQAKTNGPIYFYEFMKRNFGPQVGVGIGMGSAGMGSGMALGLTMTRVLEGYLTVGKYGDLIYIYTAENLGSILEYNINNLASVIGNVPNLKTRLDNKKNRKFSRGETKKLVDEYNNLKNASDSLAGF